MGEPGTRARFKTHFRKPVLYEIIPFQVRRQMNMDGRQKIKTYCALCVARCGAIATVEDGRFTALAPDPSHPTGKAHCAKGRASPELVYSPDRLLYPLKRTRPKGDPDPGWTRIGWDEALDLTAAAMQRAAQRYGPEAVACSQSSPSTTSLSDATPWINRLMNAFGSPNVVTSLDICGWGRSFSTRFTYGVGSVGIMPGDAMPDIDNAGCLILWGYNPSMSRLTHGTAVAEAKKRGMRLIVIDPRRIGLAGKADLWLRVRPGTDGALALGLANLLIERGWYDRRFLVDWSNGPLLVRTDTGRLLCERDLDPAGSESRYCAWDSASGAPVIYDPETGAYENGSGDPALEGSFTVATTTGDVDCQPAFAAFAALCRRYTPDVVEATCWVGREQLEQAAALIWDARPTAYYAWSGHEQHANVTQTARAMSLLYALTGSFDAPGGNVVFPTIPSAMITGADLPAAREMPPSIGAARRPLGPARWGNVSIRDLYGAILEDDPYPVRALVGFGANMLVAHADGRRGRDALSALDFYAHADMFMSPTAELADVILPVASSFEREALRLGFEVSAEAQSHAQLRPAVIPPRAESRSDVDIVFDLAMRLGLDEPFWNGDIDAAYRHQLAPSGVTLEALRDSPGGIGLPLETRHAKYAEPDETGRPRGFATPTRKVEIWSETLRANGYSALPEYVEPAMGPVMRGDLAKKFPLVLTSAKNSLYCNSQHRGVPALRKRHRDPTVEIHPDSAAARGIAPEDWVRIETPEGSVRARALFNATLDPRVVVGQHGWWQGCGEVDAPSYDPFDDAGVSFNTVIGTGSVDPISGTASHRAYLCELRPAD